MDREGALWLVGTLAEPLHVSGQRAGDRRMIVAQQQHPGNLCRNGAGARDALKTGLSAGL